MKVFAAPTDIAVPDFHPIDTYDERCDTYRDELRAWIKARFKRAGKRPHRLAGKSVFIPWADSAAEYMVLSGTELINIPLNDAWNVPDYMTRGLRVADIERMAA